MRVYSEMSLTNFNFWCGAKANAEMLTYSELEQLDYVIEDIFGDGVEDVTINDLFWFEFDTVCEWLGYRYDSDKDEIIREEEEQEEE